MRSAAEPTTCLPSAEIHVHVEVIYALTQIQHSAHLELEDGASVEDALVAVARMQPFSGLDLKRVAVGVFGRLVERDAVLRPDDRLEIYRPLLVQPMEARRARASRSRSAS